MKRLEARTLMDVLDRLKADYEDLEINEDHRRVDSPKGGFKVTMFEV
jgi:hypothetical protein